MAQETLKLCVPVLLAPLPRPDLELNGGRKWNSKCGWERGNLRGRLECGRARVCDSVSSPECVCMCIGEAHEVHLPMITVYVHVMVLSEL